MMIDVVIIIVTGWAVEIVFMVLHCFDSFHNNLISLFLMVSFLPITTRQKIAGTMYVTLKNKKNSYKILILIRLGQ